MSQKEFRRPNSGDFSLKGLNFKKARQIQSGCRFSAGVVAPATDTRESNTVSLVLYFQIGN